MGVYRGQLFYGQFFGKPESHYRRKAPAGYWGKRFPGQRRQCLAGEGGTGGTCAGGHPAPVPLPGRQGRHYLRRQHRTHPLGFVGRRRSRNLHPGWKAPGPDGKGCADEPGEDALLCPLCLHPGTAQSFPLAQPQCLSQPRPF